MNNKKDFSKKKVYNNFFLNNQEKDLIFILKKLHRLNNELGDDVEPYHKFIENMSCYYKNILVSFKNSNHSL
jgi:hypothetical protein